MTLTQYRIYLQGVADELELEYKYPPDAIESISRLIRMSRRERFSIERCLGMLETAWHKKHQLPWTAPLFTLDTPVEAVLDYWLDKGLDL